MEFVTIIGVSAVIIGTARLVPQIIKGFVTKRVRDVSIMWEILGVLSAVLWFVYGFLNDDKLLMIGTFLILISYFILIVQQFLYKGN